MIEGWPFHITHRANQRKTIFTTAEDHTYYLSLLRRYAKRYGMDIWAYCLMPNHVHLIAVGEQRGSISKAVGNTHREFSWRRNKKHDVTGHLWANRFFSTALDEPHLWAAVRYVELNPVRACLVRRAIDYRWSSAQCHAKLKDNPLLASRRPFPGPIGDWSAWLDTGLDDQTCERLRENTRTGEPSGNERFVSELEQRLGRPLPLRSNRRKR